jgi:hypothetical protein
MGQGSFVAGDVGFGGDSIIQGLKKAVARQLL